MHEALYLLDGYSLIYRSYFAFIRRPLRNPQGQNSSAIFGFFRSLLSLFSQRQPHRFLVVLDSRTPTFRHQKYEDYKSTRDKTPEDLTAQIPIIEQMLEALGVPMARVDGYEADDLIATLAASCREREQPCYIVSGDKDLLQLVDGPIRVLRPGNNGFDDLDREGVYEDWGVYPEQILDYLALTGDSSDNVPGVKGIGAKTAAKLLNQFGTLDAVYDHIDEIGGSVKTRLEQGRDSAYLSRDLVLLENSVPLDIPADRFQLPELNADLLEELACLPVMVESAEVVTAEVDRICSHPVGLSSHLDIELVTIGKNLIEGLSSFVEFTAKAMQFAARDRHPVAIAVVPGVVEGIEGLFEQ